MSNRIEFFNLAKAGDTAVVRVLLTSIDKVGRNKYHRVMVDGKARNLHCVGQEGKECPLCREGAELQEKVCIHLFDYTDNTEKVWFRTDRIVSQFKTIEADWGDLSNCVVRITRDTDDFPTYTIGVLNAAQYPAVDKSRVDVDVHLMGTTYRSKDEIEQYIATGILPDHVKAQNNASSSGSYTPKASYVPKAPYASKDVQTPAPISVDHTYRPETAPYYAPAQAPNNGTTGAPYSQQPSSTTVDPFADPFLTMPRRV